MMVQIRKGKWPAIVMLVFLAGCASYSMVGSGTHSLKGMQVTSDTAWNKAPSNAVYGGYSTSLPRVSLFSSCPLNVLKAIR